VIVASRGTAAPTYGPGDDPQYRFPLAIADIANQIEKLGGTRGGTMTALDASTNGYSYTLVGGSGYAAGTGSETRGSGTQAAWALSSTPQTDILARGNDYGFQVVDTQVGNRTPDAGSHFNQVFFQAPSAWPEKTAQQAAWIKWIGAQGTVGLGDDPRAQYWTQPYTKEYWDGKLSAIGALTYPVSDPGFCSDPTSCKDDFNWGKQELTTEIGWLEAEHGYVQTLAQPFADNVLQSWSDLQTIENDVNSKVQADPNADARLKSKLVGDFARNIAETLVESVPGLGKAVHVANLVYETAMEYTNVTGEGQQRSAEEAFQAKVRELGGKLADRLQAAKASLTRRGAEVIAADYAKLRTVGLCASGNSSCPDDIGEWQFTGDDQTNAARGLRAGLQASFYAALLPLKYTGWTLPTFTRQTPGQYFFSSPALRNPGDTMCPFDGEPASAQVAIPVARLFYPFAAQAWQVRALGYLTGDGTFFNGWQMHFPDATVTDRVFGSVDPGGDLKKGGLGLDPEAFFDVNFPSKTLDNYPYRDTATSWHDHIYNSNNHNCG
jgi:hypothetical protein